jgi:hypothetical protein
MVMREFDLQEGVDDFPADADPREIYSNFAVLPAWRVFLAHELCHEYQFAVLNDVPDDWGTKMFAERGPGRWPGPGHTAAFYSAIRSFVERFNLDLNHVLESL